MLGEAYRKAVAERLCDPAMRRCRLGRADVCETEEQFWAFLADLPWPDPATTERLHALRDEAGHRLDALPLGERVGMLNAFVARRDAFDETLRATLGAAGLLEPGRRRPRRPAWTRPLDDYAVLSGRDVHKRAATDLAFARALAASEGCSALEDALYRFEVDFLRVGVDEPEQELTALVEAMASPWRVPAEPSRFVRHPHIGAGVVASTPVDPTFVVCFPIEHRVYESEDAFWKEVLDDLFEVASYVAVGPIRFGMTRDEVGRAFEEPARRCRDPDRDMYDHGFFVDYAEDGRCEFIEFFGPCEPRIEGERFLGNDYVETVTWFAARDPALVRDAAGLVSPGLGTTIFAENGIVRGVGVFRSGYFR